MRIGKWIIGGWVLWIGLGASAATILYWGGDNSFGGSGNIVDLNGVPVPAGTDWRVELVNTADGSVLAIETNGFSGAAGEFFVNAVAESWWDGIDVKTVIYDASTYEEALYYAEFSIQQTLSIPFMPPLPGMEPEYNAGSVTSNAWHLVPVDPAEWAASDPVGTVHAPGGTNVLQYVYTRRKDAPERGITYTVQTCSSLASNSWVSLTVENETFGSLDSVYDRVTNDIPVGTNSPLYVRMLMDDSAAE